MIQFFSECLLWVNVPWTILLVMAGAYWLLTSFGAVEMRSLDPEISDELRVGSQGGSPEPAQRRGLARLFSNFLKFLHYGQAPLIFIATIFAGAGFIFSVFGNFFLGMDENLIAGLGWGLLSFLAAACVVHVSVRPIADFFRNRNYETREIREIVGKQCIVRTLECTERYGQVEIKKLRGAPRILEARTAPGQSLQKGAAAVVTEHDKERGAYIICAVEAPKPAAPEEDAVEVPLSSKLAKQ